MNSKMKSVLEKLGLDADTAAFFARADAVDGTLVGRVVIEHREAYVVETERGRFNAQITGNMRFSAKNRAEFPAVGDWVSILVYDESLAIIQVIAPRRSILERQAVDRSGEKQLIAANVDTALLMQAVDQDYSLNRLERYITICNAGGIRPVGVFNKIDLIDADARRAIERDVRARAPDLEFVCVSNVTGDGFADLRGVLRPGQTFCILGSSGVGKSTLINRLTESTDLKTAALSESHHKGRHTTTHREMIVTDHHGILIDTPGMRELGITESGEGLEATFDRIAALERACKFTNCTHADEAGCQVREALADGRIDPAAYENFQKMKREQRRFEMTVREKRVKEKRQAKLYRAIIARKRREKGG